VDTLDRDYSSCDASIYAADAFEMIATATAEFEARHPNAPERAVEILAWCYSFDHR
jgi:hypothetical protein